jgi:hypothetical protein
MKSKAPYHLDRVSPHIEEIGRSDARVDAQAGNRERYAAYLGFLAEGHLSAPNWHAYRAGYEAERARLSSEPA